MTNQVSKERIRNLRYVGVAEGISFLVLLFIAMPLKYWGGIPEAVKVTGWVHGILFIWYILVLALAQFTFRWPIWKVAGAFVASLIPFGTFVLDKKLKEEEISIQR